MPQGPIRELGEYQVLVHLHTEVEAAVSIAVTGQ
jgi:ribosomal protein L9